MMGKTRPAKGIPTTTQLVRTLKKKVTEVGDDEWAFCLVVYKGEPCAGYNGVIYNIDKRKVFAPQNLSDGIGYLFEMSLSHAVARLEMINNWRWKQSHVNALSLDLVPSMDGKTNLNPWFIESVCKLLGVETEGL